MGICLIKLKYLMLIFMVESINYVEMKDLISFENIGKRCFCDDLEKWEELLDVLEFVCNIKVVVVGFVFFEVV